MKNIFLFSICLFILGCSSTKRISKIDLIGTYRWYGFFESGAEFELKSDSTFIYESGNGLAIQKSTGKWTIRNKELIFNSDLQPKDTLIQYFLIKKGIVNNDSITIQAIAENDEFLPLISATFFKNSKFLFTAFDSIEKKQLTIPKINFDSLIISFISFYSVKYKRTDSSNYFKFKMIPVLYDYKFFTNKHYLVKKNRVVDLEIKINDIVKSNSFKKEIKAP